MSWASDKYKTDPEYRERVKARSLEYQRRPEVKARRQQSSKERRETDPEWLERRRAATRKSNRKRYGIAEATGEQRYGICELCGKLTAPPDRPLYCDHNHVTRKFRGWICMRCNSGLGFFDDNQETVQKAAEYLKR